MLRVVRPLAYPTERWKPIPKEEQDSLAAHIWEPLSSTWTTSSRRPDGLEAMWTLFCTAVEHYMEARSQDALDLPRRRYQGRGRHQSPRRGPAAAPQRASVPGALGQQQLHLLKLARRVEEFLRHLPEDGPSVLPHRQVRLWTSIYTAARRLLDPSTAWASVLRDDNPPPRPALFRALAGLRVLCQELTEQTRCLRRNTWTAWVQSGWHHAPGRLYRHTKGETTEAPATMLQRPDRSFTAHPGEMDELLRAAWGPIFAMYKDLPEPSWEPFAQRFGRYVQTIPMNLGDLTAQDLRATLSKQSSRCAAGVEGWRVAELKALPDLLLDKLAQVLNKVEQSGRWPRALERALVALVPRARVVTPLPCAPSRWPAPCTGFGLPPAYGMR